MILQCPECSARFLVDNSLIPVDGREVKCAKCAHTWHAMPEAPEPVVEETPFEAEVEETTNTDDVVEENAINEDDVALAEAELAASAEPDAPEEDVEYIDFGQTPTSDDPAQIPDIELQIEPSTSKPAATENAGIVKPALIAACILFALTTIVTGLLAFRPALQPSLQPVYSLLGASATDGLMLSDVTIRERRARNKKRFVIEGKVINLSDAPRVVPIVRAAIHDAAGEVVMSRSIEGGMELAPGESKGFQVSDVDTSFTDRVDHIIVDLGNNLQLMVRE